jgi:hypothetical protein
MILGKTASRNIATLLNKHTLDGRHPALRCGKEARIKDYAIAKASGLVMAPYAFDQLPKDWSAFVWGHLDKVRPSKPGRQNPI